MDDFESPEVQKDFPGLKEEPESKKEKEKKDKKDKKDKEKGYATLAGDSSQDEEGDTKSPSKSTKRIKAFKFPLKKEKREKSKDKEPTSTEREPGEGKEKKKEKKDKKDKKVKSSAADELPQDLGDVLPIFGVPLSLAVERSRCHDMDNVLPLVIRDCIDYLQQDGIVNNEIYKVEPVKAKLQQLKRSYNNRESNGPQDLDLATAAGLLKLFLKELPEPILTAELISQFEEVSAISNVQEQETQMKFLIAQLPDVNQTLLKWVFLHLDAVTERSPMNAQLLALILSQTLQMSHRLFVTILCHCRFLFTPAVLPRYIPPLSGANPVLPEARDNIIMELRKQESVLTQIHSEMNLGFATKRREEQLWEVQRIVTQLKRKLRQFDKKGDSVQKSLEDTVDSTASDPNVVVEATGSVEEKEESVNILTITDTGFLALPPDNPDANNFLQLQLENYELNCLKNQLQASIDAERAEIIHLQEQTKYARAVLISNEDEGHAATSESETLMQELYLQQAYLESIRVLLCEEILKEQISVATFC